MTGADLRAAHARQANIEAAIRAHDYPAALALIDDAVEFLGNIAATTDDPTVFALLVRAASYMTEASVYLVRYV